jgi:hypothetical protein
MTTADRHPEPQTRAVADAHDRLTAARERQTDAVEANARANRAAVDRLDVIARALVELAEVGGGHVDGEWCARLDGDPPGPGG